MTRRMRWRWKLRPLKIHRNSRGCWCSRCGSSDDGRRSSWLDYRWCSRGCRGYTRVKDAEKISIHLHLCVKNTQRSWRSLGILYDDRICITIDLGLSGGGCLSLRFFSYCLPRSEHHRAIYHSSPPHLEWVYTRLTSRMILTHIYSRSTCEHELVSSRVRHARPQTHVPAQDICCVLWLIRQSLSQRYRSHSGLHLMG